MQDWRTLLAAPRFRALWLALVSNNLGSWSVIAALPILVAGRFGAGSELVLSLGLRLLPKILLAPVAGQLLRRFGPVRIAGLALAGEAMLTASLPFCEDFVLFQAIVAAIGTLDVFVMPALLSLRGPAMRDPSMPAGLEMAGNTLCSVADRLAKIVGPTIGGLAVLAGFTPAFLLFGALVLAASLAVSRLPQPAAEDTAGHQGLTAFWRLPAELFAILRADAVLLGLFIAAATYMIMLGGLRPFLFWANRDWFGNSDAAWTGLMAAQGAGALLGALVSGFFSRVLLRRMSAYMLTLLAGLLEGMLHLALLLAGNWMQAMAILAMASISEILSTAAWFTAMQQRLGPRRQALYFSLAIPLWDCGYALGLLSAALHTNGTLSLASYWALVSLASTLPLLPLLARASRQPRPARPE